MYVPLGVGVRVRVMKQIRFLTPLSLFFSGFEILGLYLSLSCKVVS